MGMAAGGAGGNPKGSETHRTLLRVGSGGVTENPAPTTQGPGQKPEGSGDAERAPTRSAWGMKRPREGNLRSYRTPLPRCAAAYMGTAQRARGEEEC